MSQAGATSKLDQLGLEDAECARLTSWMPEIAAELSPGAPVRRHGSETRVGRKGSLVVYDDGGWHSYEADEGGHGPRSLIEFLCRGIGIAEVRQKALAWLHTHTGVGSGDGNTDSRARDRDAEHADFSRVVLNAMEPVKGTPAALYLETRGLGADWPLSLLGYVADDERPDEGAIVGVISNANGAPVGVQLGYLDALGRKLPIGGTARRQFLVDRQSLGLGFHIVPAQSGPALPLLICEGLENALSLALAYPAAAIVGLPGIGRMRRLPPFRGRDIVVFRDGDAADSPASRALAAGLDHLQLTGAQVRVTNTPDGADANSVLQEGGPDAVKALVEAAVPAELSPKGIIHQAASLPEVDYEMQRQKCAKALGIRVSAFDRQVLLERARRRGDDDASDAGEGEDIHTEPVNDIAGVLDAALVEVKQYVVAEPWQLEMVVMWSLHSHFVHHSTIDIAISPRLLIAAPAPECGKTTLLEATGELAARAMELSSVSPAAFYRLNDAERPTLLIDEIQGLFARKGSNSELEGILNASHRRRSAKVVRVEEEQEDGKRRLVPKVYDSWCTYSATITGRLSYAQESRALKVMMRRALAGEVLRHLQDGTSEVLVDCRRKFARWAKDQLVLPEATLLPQLSNRRGDNWRPLFKIAELVGSHWPQKIEAAARAAMEQTGSADVIVAFLADAREIIGERDHILTTELIDALLTLEDPSWDWKTCHRGGPVNAYWLRDRLADVLDPPGTKEFKVGNKSRRGYEARQFQDAYDRYLNRHNPSEHTTAEPRICAESGGDSCGASASSATDTNNLRKTQDIYPVADGQHPTLEASATKIDPLPNAVPEAVSGSGSRPVADTDRNHLPHPLPDDSVVFNSKESSRCQIKGMKSGKPHLSRTIPPGPASESQPISEEVDELW
jgi:putative DNA primase/helicase